MTLFDIEVQVDAAETGLTLSEAEVGVKTAVLTTLQQEAVAPPVALTILLTDDATIQQLNRDFRQEDKATDVLSFAAGEPLPGLAEPEPYLGDIAISVPYARHQAQQQGHHLLAELQLLAIHGVLHLLGYDHGDEAEKAAMWAAQTAVLTRLGLAHVLPTEQ